MPKRISRVDLILREARRLATDMLEQRLRQENLPLPKDSNLEIHLDQLIKINPSIMALAEARVNAKIDAYSKSMKAIGIDLDPGPVEPVDLGI